MIITDFNQMTVEELMVIYMGLGIEFDINDGMIVGATRQ